MSKGETSPDIVLPPEVARKEQSPRDSLYQQGEYWEARECVSPEEAEQLADVVNWFGEWQEKTLVRGGADTPHDRIRRDLAKLEFAVFAYSRMSRNKGYITLQTVLEVGADRLLTAIRKDIAEPSLAQAYRERVEQLKEAWRHDQAIRNLRDVLFYAREDMMRNDPDAARKVQEAIRAVSKAIRNQHVYGIAAVELGSKSDALEKEFAQRNANKKK